MTGQISGYTSMGAVATGDLMPMVDISDTTTSPAGPGGSDKKITASALGIYLSGWRNLVRDYGADPTGTTSIATALSTACTAAVAAQPAAFPLEIPAGHYLVTAPQDLPYNMIIRGAGANGGSVSGQYIGTWFFVSSSFSGTYVFGFKDSPAPTTFTGDNGCWVTGIGIFGGNQTASAVNGIYVVGPTLTTLQYVTMTSMSGWAMASGVDSSAGEQFPFGQNWLRVQADSCGVVSGGGFQLSGCEDSTFTNCYAIGNNNGPGFQITACDNTKFIGCNAEWNSSSQGYGYYITGDWQYFTGGCIFSGCSTDSNRVYGMYIDATWTTGGGAGTGPGIIHVEGCHFRRDGSAGGTVTAGIAIGATTLPLIINGFSTMPSIGDGGAGSMNPSHGLLFTQSTYAQPILVANGLAWGLTAAYRTGSTNNTLPTLTTGATSNILKAHGNNYAPTYGS